MQTALVVGSLLPAGIGLGCCLHRRHWCGLIAMVAMVGGMTDAMLLGHRLLPEAEWVVVFAVAAAAQFLAAEPTRVLRIAELGVMSLLMVAVPSTTTAETSAGTVPMMIIATSVRVVEGLVRHGS